MIPYFATIFILSVFSYALWYFVFNIYEVKFDIKYLEKISSDRKKYEIVCSPINLLGKTVPYRRLNFDYEIEEGIGLVEIQKRENKKELFLTSLNDSGIVVLIMKTKLSLFPQILKLDLAKDN